MLDVLHVRGDERLQLLEKGHAWGQLQQQAFLQIAGGDAGRVELLHDGQGPLGQGMIFLRRVQPQKVFQAALQVAVGIEVVDDPLAHRPQVRLDLEPTQLVAEIVLQGLRPGDHVGHGVELSHAGLFHLGPRRTRAFLEVFGPLLVHLHQPLEVVLVLGRFVDDQFALLLGGRVGRSLTLDFGRFRGQIRIVLAQVEHGILLDLLLDPLLQGQDGQLQNLHGLDHPRRQNHLLLLRDPHALIER